MSDGLLPIVGFTFLAHCEKIYNFQVHQGVLWTEVISIEHVSKYNMRNWAPKKAIN